MTKSFVRVVGCGGGAIAILCHVAPTAPPVKNWNGVRMKERKNKKIAFVQKIRGQGLIIVKL